MQKSKKSDEAKAKRKQAEVRRSAYADMAGAGIKSLSGATTADKKGAEAREIQRDFYEDRGVSPDRIEELVPTRPGDKVVTEDKKEVIPEKEKEQIRYDTGDGTIGYRDLILLEKKLGQKAIIRNGKVFFVDETGSTVPAFAMMDKLRGALDKFTGFDPTKAFGDMGDTGKAALFNKISKMSGPEFEKFLNRKGNLDRLLDFAEEGGVANKNRSAVMAAIKNNDPSMFANLIKGSGGEDFESELSKIRNPQKYWEDNPPRTQGDLEEAAMAGVPWARDQWNKIKDQQDIAQGFASPAGVTHGGGGGGGDTTDPTDPTTTTVPDYILKQQYMPGFTPSYTGGAEQMHIAGGYWDPRTQKWIGGGPWGTTGQYQFPITTMAQGGIVGTSPLLFKNQGGMVNDNGIKAFKKYGY